MYSTQFFYFAIFFFFQFRQRILFWHCGFSLWQFYKRIPHFSVGNDLGGPGREIVSWSGLAYKQKLLGRLLGWVWGVYLDVHTNLK